MANGWFRSGDGYRIPRSDNPLRAKWDEDYLGRVRAFLGDEGYEYVPASIPLDKLTGGHIVMPGHPRTDFYTRLYKLGERVPPIVVTELGTGFYHLLDGSRRQGSATMAGVTHIPGLIRREKAEKKPKKGKGGPFAYTTRRAIPYQGPTPTDMSGKPIKDWQRESLSKALDVAATRIGRMAVTPSQAMMKAPAFRHRKTGQVIESPVFHDMDRLPEPERDSGIWEDGFIDHEGKFYNREDAQRAVDPNAQKGDWLESQQYAEGVDQGVYKSEDVVDLSKNSRDVPPPLPPRIARVMWALAQPGVLSDELRESKYRENPNTLAGHCFVASNALYHLIDGPRTGWEMRCIHREHMRPLTGDDSTHWFLFHRKTGTILDPTADQFESRADDIPYSKGVAKGTSQTGDDVGHPTKRAQVVIGRVHQLLHHGGHFSYLGTLEHDGKDWYIQPPKKLGKAEPEVDAAERISIDDVHRQGYDWFHLTSKPPDENGVFHAEPRRPRTPMPGEDRNTKRVSVGPSIWHCLAGLEGAQAAVGAGVDDMTDWSPDMVAKDVRRNIAQFSGYRGMHVYGVKKPKGLVLPSVEQVPDAGLTGEAWLTKPTKMKHVGQLQVQRKLGENEWDDEWDTFRPAYDVHLTKAESPPLQSGSILFQSPDSRHQEWDYTHMLPEAARKEGYRIRARFDTAAGGATILATKYVDGRSRPAGQLIAHWTGKTLKPWEVHVEDRDRRKKVAMGMYKALYAHAASHLGLNQVSGDVHSTASHLVHKKLAAQYRLDYQTKPNLQPGQGLEDWLETEHGDFDSRYSKYKYRLPRVDRQKPVNMFAEHTLPGSLHAEGYRLNVSHTPDATIGVVHRNGHVYGHTEVTKGGQVFEEWTGAGQRHGLQDAVMHVLRGHAQGQMLPDEWNNASKVTAPQPMMKAEDLEKMAKLTYDTPEFQQWFQGSKVVDEQGQPLRVFHGTSKDKDFHTFKVGQRGSWFTNDPENASLYAAQNDSSEPTIDYEGGKFNVRQTKNTRQRVLPVHLSIKNPYRLTPQEQDEEEHVRDYAQWQRDTFGRAKVQGYDGVDMGNGVWVAFNPNQIKSVFNNIPTQDAHLSKNVHLDSLYARAVAQRKQYGAKSSAWRHPESGQVVAGKGFIHDPADLDGQPEGDWKRGYILKDGSFLDAKTFDDLSSWTGHFQNFGKAEDPYQYHVTYGSNLKSIAQRGLLPNYRSTFPSLSQKGKLYFTDRSGIERWKPFFASDPAVIRWQPADTRSQPDPHGHPGDVLRDEGPEGIDPAEFDVQTPEGHWVPLHAWTGAQPADLDKSESVDAPETALRKKFSDEMGPAQGSHITQPHTTYTEAAVAKPKGQEYGGGKNLWARNHQGKSNANRTLMVQFSSDLLQGNRKRDESDDYYDNLYSKREGYKRASDFWEIPQWQAHLAHSMPDADHYTVRDPEEAARFLREAGYKHVAFSALDVNKDFVKRLAQEAPDQHIVVGGYTDMAHFAGLPNVSVHPSIQSFVESEGREYRPGYDYRHFTGTPVIPRLTLSDGCRHQCTFCCVPKKVDEKTREEILQQADAFAEHLPSDLIYLNDKTFGQAQNHAMLPELYQRIRAKNPAFKGFVIQTTAAQMKRFTPEFLKAAGIRHVELGIESVNDPILRAHKKPANEAIIEDAANKVRAAGASLIPNIMVGLPGEDRNTYGRTMAWLQRHRDIISHVNTYNLALYEDSELGKKLNAISAGDRDENVQQKSWHTDPAAHADFARSLLAFANSQLNQPIGHTPVQKSEDDLAKMSTPAGKAIYEEMRFRNPQVLEAWRERFRRLNERGLWHGYDEEFHPDKLKRAPVTINFQPDVVDDLIHNGRFLNRHDVAEEGDVDQVRGILETDPQAANTLAAGYGEYLGERTFWENNRFDIPIDELSGDRRPIYGALHYHHEHPTRGPEGGGGVNYGYLWVKLKPHVKRRTTFTSGDSFTESADDGVFVNNAENRVALAQAHILNNPRQPHSHGASDTQAPYIEAQIHGGVRLDRDVQSVHLAPMHDWRGNPMSADFQRRALDQAKKLGQRFNLPVYDHRGTMVHDPLLSPNRTLPPAGLKSRKK